MTKILFLDIDGVLNNHTFLGDIMYCGIQMGPVYQLNRIWRETNCSLVISSAWRYMILGGEMTVKGFEYMLKTHGIAAPVIGHTVSDENFYSSIHPNIRGYQIQWWLDDNAVEAPYCVVDDLDLGISELHPFVQTDGTKGMVSEDADKIIEILNKGGK